MSAIRPTAFPLPLVGWKEEVRLPGLSHDAVLVAKIDTGARSSALHAEDILIAGKRVSFRFGEALCKMKLLDIKHIKSSNGISELRPVVELEVEVGGKSFLTPVTLADRTGMDLPMLLGREAIKGRFLVHAGRVFMHDPKDRRK
jgi:hypothetical protein